MRGGKGLGGCKFCVDNDNLNFLMLISNVSNRWKGDLFFLSLNSYIFNVAVAKEDGEMYESVSYRRIEAILGLSLVQHAIQQDMVTDDCFPTMTVLFHEGLIY